jgi:hypothetical protein
VHHFVSTAVAQQVCEDAEAEDEGREYAATAALKVQRHARADSDYAHARHLATLAALPLPERQVSDVITVRRQTLSEIPIPALSTANGVREEAVIDEAYTHAGRQRLADLRYHRRPARRDFFHRDAFIRYERFALRPSS